MSPPWLNFSTLSTYSPAVTQSIQPVLPTCIISIFEPCPFCFSATRASHTAPYSINITSQPPLQILFGTYDNGIESSGKRHPAYTF
ncbi:uncharacterized protein K441DRAFT_341269 [Cenococcum geophilum 1.58]|uniref:uncharacterized protein n=1 Tax=Cenococcum geophilum 1.58 TaxID=794803 RepID=UPI00358EDF30|nr:hypothetical protein K441DRAFT_341269 [Cenococcum geophilum 1.58]